MEYTIRELPTPPNECRTCLGPHDDETHAATEAIHDWFREHVTRYLPPAIELKQAS
jgi:hypothetical protein